MRLELFGSLLLSALVGGCVSGPFLQPRLRTWDEVPPDSPRTGKPSQQVQAARPTQTMAERIEQFEGGGKKQPQQSAGHPTAPRPGEMGHRVDRGLTRLVASRAGTPPTKPGAIPSPQVLGQWQEIFGVLDSALDLQPTAEDLGSLVRARVTLEVEMDRDRERFPELPHELTVAYIQSLEKIDRRVRELHASHDSHSFTARLPRNPGDLVLEWPLRTVMPSSPFGYRRDPLNGRLKFHSGIDLVAAQETPVYSAAPGVVVFAAWSGGYGKYVVVEHAHGVRSHYAHLAHLFVSAGTLLEERSPIGTVGNTGRSTGHHLHYSVSLNGRYVDPTLYTNTPIAADGSIPDS